MSEHYEYHVDSRSGLCTSIVAPQSTVAEALRKNLDAAGISCTVDGTVLTITTEKTIQEIAAVANPNTVRSTISSTPTLTSPPDGFTPRGPEPTQG